MRPCVSIYLWHDPIYPSDRPLPAEDRSGVPDSTYNQPRAHARERATTDMHKHAKKSRCRLPWRGPRASPTAAAVAPWSTRTLRVKLRPPTPHPSTSRAPVHPKQAKTRVRMNACKAIWAQSRGFEAAGGGLRTVRSRRSAPIEPSEVLARQAEHPEGGGREKQPECQHP